MKTINFKAFLILGGLMLLNIQTASASILGGIKKFAAEQITNFHLEALWGIGAIVVVGLIIYYVSNHLDTKEGTNSTQAIKHRPYNQQKHIHIRPIVKKTA